MPFRSKMSPCCNAAAVDASRASIKEYVMRKKILVVDDDAELVELVSFNLKQAGYAVGTAANGVDAIKKAHSLTPDLIVLDVMMPELDGFAVCEILRRDTSTALIPIMMLTALSSELGRMAGLGSGATDFLTKPFSPRLLVARIEELLKKASDLTRTAAA
jgi:two-component system, OmpR family, alkaline phosphatase synthesis response regulator PhoP